MILFFIGIIEMLIVTSWTKMVAKTKILSSGAITLVNVLIWFYVLRIIVEDINNWYVALFYAIGCSLGTMISTFFFSISEREAN